MLLWITRAAVSLDCDKIISVIGCGEKILHGSHRPPESRYPDRGTRSGLICDNLCLAAPICAGRSHLCAELVYRDSTYSMRSLIGVQPFNRNCLFFAADALHH